MLRRLGLLIAFSAWLALSGSAAQSSSSSDLQCIGVYGTPIRFLSENDNFIIAAGGFTLQLFRKDPSGPKRSSFVQFEYEITSMVVVGNAIYIGQDDKDSSAQLVDITNPENPVSRVLSSRGPTKVYGSSEFLIIEHGYEKYGRIFEYFILDDPFRPQLIKETAHRSDQPWCLTKDSLFFVDKAGSKTIEISVNEAKSHQTKSMKIFEKQLETPFRFTKYSLKQETHSLELIIDDDSTKDINVVDSNTLQIVDSRVRNVDVNPSWAPQLNIDHLKVADNFVYGAENGNIVELDCTQASSILRTCTIPAKAKDYAVEDQSLYILEPGNISTFHLRTNDAMAIPDIQVPPESFGIASSQDHVFVFSKPNSLTLFDRQPDGSLAFTTDTRLGEDGEYLLDFATSNTEVIGITSRNLVRLKFANGRISFKRKMPYSSMNDGPEEGWEARIKRYKNCIYHIVYEQLTGVFIYQPEIDNYIYTSLEDNSPDLSEFSRNEQGKEIAYLAIPYYMTTSSEHYYRTSLLSLTVPNQPASASEFLYGANNLTLIRNRGYFTLDGGGLLVVSPKK